MLAEFEELIRSSEPILAQTLSDAILGGWVQGAASVAGQLPPVPPIAASGPPGDPPSGWDLLYPSPDDDPIVILTGIDNAVSSLLERDVMSPQDFYRLGGAAKQQAFTITADLTRAAIDDVREALAETVSRGASLEEFTREVESRFDTLPISPGHLENVYRSNIQEAFSQGMERILDHPIVADGFPFRIYVPVHDARARKSHRDLETLGLDGTAVYWADDPTWIRFRPPWDFNCRCGWIPCSVETAASLGVRQAIEWLETGIEPRHQWVTPPPFSPSPSWERIAVAV